MDWRAAAAAGAVAQLTQQNGAPQYSYTSSSYTGQQAAAQQPSSTGSAAYNPAYLTQTVVAPGGYGSNTTYGSNNVNAAQQLWSQRSTEQSQAGGYGGRLAVTTTIPSGGGSTTATGGASAGQFGPYGVYGAAVAAQQQQLLGVASKTGVSDYQTSSGGGGSGGSGGGARTSSYGGNGNGSGVGSTQDNRVAPGSGASYVTGGGNIGGGGGGGSVSGVYESGKYYATSGLQYNTSNQQQQPQQQQHKGDQQQSYTPYANTAALYGVDTSQLQQLQQPQGDTRYYYQDARGTTQGLLGAYHGDASGLLGALGTYQQTQAHQQQAYTTARYPPASPSIGYGGVSLPPGRDYGTGRVSGGTMFHREGSYSRTERIGSSRFDDRMGAVRDDERRIYERDRDREMERDREKERERERERREREREERRNRSPPIPRTRRDASPKKEDKRKDSPRLHRHLSPTSKESKRRDYVFKIETGNVVQSERELGEVLRRHSKLYIAPEFSKLRVCWMGHENDVAIEKSASFEHESVDVDDESEIKDPTPTKSAEKPQKGSVLWNVRVMLMSGLTADCLADFVSDKTSEKPPNYHKMIKFVALRRDRNAIMPAGGRWDKTLDGGDPAADSSALIRTAIRTVKESTQIDLSECKEWIRFAEVHYERLDDDGFSNHKEISVFFLPKITDCLPSVENWQLQWNSRKQAKLDRDTAAKKEKSEDKPETETEEANGSVAEKDLEVKEEKHEKDEKKEKDRDAKEKVKEEPPEPGFVVVSKRSKSTKMRSMTISLDGLLDYDENDKDESSFELSLFAEAFAEMLQFKMGSHILQHLESLRRSSHNRRREEKKRARQAEVEKEDAKRRKLEEAKPAEIDTRMEQADVTPSADVTPMDLPNSQETTTTTATEADTEVPTTEKPSSESDPPTTEVKNTEIVKESPPPEVKEVVPDEKKNDTSKKEKNGGSKKDKEKKKKPVDKDLLKAYRYFDKNRAGYLKADDLKKLLYSLGKGLCLRVTKELTTCAVAESGRSRDERVVYRVLVEKELSVPESR